eukprot:SAG31_NODE_6793_length_1885_cov_3.047032_1_plen_91_part_00
MTRTSFVDSLRLRLGNASRHLTVPIDVKAYSGISFRKGSLRAGDREGIPTHALADMADHASMDVTRLHYLGDSVQSRAARTASLGTSLSR